MGNFFRNEADLRSEIESVPKEFLDRLIHALDAANRLDLQDDVKDAVVAVSTAAGTDDDVGPAEILMDILSQGIGVDEKVQRRISP